MGDVRVDILLEYFDSKYLNPDPGEAEVRRSKAIERWLSTERTNRRTNSRIHYGHDLFWHEHISFSKLIATVRKFVGQVLCVPPSLNLLHGGFSSGATTSRRRSDGHPAIKFLGKADVTRLAQPLFFDLIKGSRWGDHWASAGLETRIVSGNCLFTVPKNSDIDRVACKEPDINVFLQKLFGNQIRILLKRVGVDLNNQGVNAELARQGSITNRLMTIDLSSASDSVTTELVRLLLPSDWFYYMDLVRSPYTVIDGVEHFNEMFSSMGNGFTFELESLLFYSITRAVSYLLGVRGKVSVYGDDIIAPSEIYEPLNSALGFFGFKVNESKSFYDSPFRESCGAFWYQGLDVKPFYIRRKLRRLSDLILVLNQLAQWATDCGVFDPRFLGFWTSFRDLVPSSLWGGQDFTSRLSLVTGHAPRKELKPVTRMKKFFHTGGLLFWLFLAEQLKLQERDGIAITTSSDTGLCRLRRNTQNRRMDLPWFLLEEESEAVA